MAELCQATASAVEGGGSVLLLVDPEVRALEMVEALCERLQNSAPLLYVSPVAADLVAAARAMPEWVAAPRLAQVPPPHLTLSPLP